MHSPESSDAAVKTGAQGREGLSESADHGARTHAHS